MIKKRTNELEQDELEIGGSHSRSEDDAPIERETISKEELKKEVLANANQNQADFDWDKYEGGKNLSKAERKEMDTQEWALIKGCMNQAVVQLNGFRDTEGKSLQKDFEDRLGKISLYLEEIKKPFQFIRNI